MVIEASDRRLSIVADVDLPDSGTASAIRPGGQQLAVVGEDNVLRAFDLGGRQLWETVLDQSASLFEQGSSVIPENDPLRIFFEEIKPLSSIYIDDRELVVSTGALLYRFDWDGNELAPPWFMTGGPGPGQVTMEFARSVLMSEDGPRSIVSRSGVWTQETNIEPELDGATIQVRPIEGFKGGGLPNFINGRSTVIGDVHLVADGSLVLLDATSLTADQIAETPSGSGIALAVKPGELDVVAVASRAGGITLVDLLGAGPISSAFARSPGSGNLTISEDGSTALAAGTGSPAPSELWRRESDQWVRLSFRDGLVDVYGAIAAKEGNVIELRDSNDLTWIYTFDEGLITEVTRELPVLSAFAGDKNTTVGLIALSGGPSPGDPVRVETFPQYQRVIVLPIPEVDGGTASAVGVQFDPDAQRLLVGMPDGQFDVWDVATWQRIDVGEWRDEQIALATWNADGSRVATAAPDGSITIRNGTTFEPALTMIGSVGTSNSWNDGSLLFSEDSSLLLTNIDGVGRLWDVESGQQIGLPFESARGTNSGVNVGENGLQLITGSERGALVWNLDSDTWPEIACRTAGSNLTEDEWTQWGPRDEPYREVCP